jgi:hypothetical protein
MRDIAAASVLECLLDLNYLFALVCAQARKETAAKHPTTNNE